MRIAEVMARVDEKSVSIDDAVIDALQKKLEKEINRKHIRGNGIIPLVEFVPFRFQLGIERIPESKFRTLDIIGKDLREIRAINSRAK